MDSDHLTMIIVMVRKTFLKKLFTGLLLSSYILSSSSMVFAAEPIPGNCEFSISEVGGAEIIPRTASKNVEVSKGYENVQFVFYLDPAYTFDEQRIVGDGVSSQVSQIGLEVDPLGTGLNRYSATLNLISSNGSLLEVVNEELPLRLEQRNAGGAWQTFCPTVTVRAVSDETCSIPDPVGFSDKILLNLAYDNFRPSAEYKLIFEDDDELPEHEFQVNSMDGTYQFPEIPHNSIPRTVFVAIRRRTGSGATQVDATGNLCEASFLIGNEEEPPGATRPPVSPIPDDPGVTGPPQKFDACKQAGTSYGVCQACADTGGLWTGVGCIPVKDTTQMVNALLTIGLGIAGAVVVMMALAGGFLMSTSQGDIKRVEEARSLITSAVSGILFIIFSVTLLRYIGVQILQLPGF